MSSGLKNRRDANDSVPLPGDVSSGRNGCKGSDETLVACLDIDPIPLTRGQLHAEPVVIARRDALSRVFD
jgi:hypothetical protein